MNFKVNLAFFACFGYACLSDLCAQISWPGDHVFGGNLQVGTTGTTGAITVYGGTGSAAMPALSLSGHGGIIYQAPYFGGTPWFSGDTTMFRWKSDDGSLAIGDSQVFANDFSLAVGKAAVAIGRNSLAVGSTVSAEADFSVALGGYNAALRSYSIAAGILNAVAGLYSVVLGSQSYVEGENSILMGFESICLGSFAFTMGPMTSVGDDYSIAFGYTATTFGEGAVAVGKSTTAVGLYSMAFGRNTLAEDELSVVIGEFNAPVVHGGKVAFVIGNGQDEERKSNALTVWKNGNVKFTGTVELPRQGDILMGQFGN